MTNSEVTIDNLGDVFKGLSLTAKGLYYFIPDTCWMTEKTMAKALHTHPKAIREAKKELEAAGLIKIQRGDNKYNKVSQLHIIVKVVYSDLYLIHYKEEWEWVLRARNSVLYPDNKRIEENSSKLLSNNLVELPDNRKTSRFSLNFDLLNGFSAAEINKLSKLEQVELYMEAGFLVLPTHYPIFSVSGGVSCSCKNFGCTHAGKHPYVQSFKNLTPETYQKRRTGYLRRFKKDKNLNVGFKPYGFSVLDVDYKNAGSITLGLLREEVPGLDETLSVKSPNGEHLYTSTVGLKQSAGLLGEGLDIRSDRTTGFIVAPGSLHKSGKEYLWSVITDLEPIPDEWLNGDSDNTSLPARVRKKTGRNLKDIKIPPHVYPGYFIPEGRRYDTLFKFACRERGRGANEGHIYDVLVTIRDTYCEESKDPKDAVTDFELRAIAKNVVRYYSTNAEKFSKAA